MNNGQTIALGLTAFACSMLLLAFGVNAVGQIHGTFTYVPPDSLIGICEWILSFVGGIGFASLGASGLVAWRQREAMKQIETKDPPPPS